METPVSENIPTPESVSPVEKLRANIAEKFEKSLSEYFAEIQEAISEREKIDPEFATARKAYLAKEKQQAVFVASQNTQKLASVADGLSELGVAPSIPENMEGLGEYESQIHTELRAQEDFNGRQSSYVPQVALKKVEFVKKNNEIEGTILAGDVAVRVGNTIFEKPKTKEEFAEVLKTISGQMVQVRAGLAFSFPVTENEVVTKRISYIVGVFIKDISLEEQGNIANTFDQKTQSIAGGIDYSDPENQFLFSENRNPALLLRLEKDKESIDDIPRELCPELKDYFLGFPKELVRAVIKEIQKINTQK